MHAGRQAGRQTNKHARTHTRAQPAQAAAASCAFQRRSPRALCHQQLLHGRVGSGSVGRHGWRRNGQDDLTHHAASEEPAGIKEEAVHVPGGVAVEGRVAGGGPDAEGEPRLEVLLCRHHPHGEDLEKSSEAPQCALDSTIEVASGAEGCAHLRAQVRVLVVPSVQPRLHGRRDVCIVHGGAHNHSVRPEHVTRKGRLGDAEQPHLRASSACPAGHCAGQRQCVVAFAVVGNKDLAPPC
mmetsp:Transcript_17128/g.53750  ORF Transcript_17128/g.53750 Transcript_17128/m.53750 type:complete len:239 (-) Transcript_17128:52-768(-)